MERNTRDNFAIGIPTLNRADLLVPSLMKYLYDFQGIKIYVLDNGNQDIPKTFGEGIEVIKNEKNIGVGPSWNVLCRKIYENFDNALILNDDIYLGKKTENISSIISKYRSQFITATPDWCAFIISRDIFDKVGPFDECFYPAYYEDNSYAYRMKLKGVSHCRTPYLNPELYRVSQTIDKDKSLFEYRTKNKKLYIEMWGGLPEREKFTKPFNK
jgi:GT2 family glycosyltransferase